MWITRLARIRSGRMPRISMTCGVAGTTSTRDPDGCEQDLPTVERHPRPFQPLRQNAHQGAEQAMELRTEMLELVVHVRQPQAIDIRSCADRCQAIAPADQGQSHAIEVVGVLRRRDRWPEAAEEPSGNGPQV